MIFNLQKVNDQLNSARDSLTAARSYLAQLEDYTAERPINVDYLKILSFARSAVKTLEIAVDNADRTMLFTGNRSLYQTKRPSLVNLERDISSSSDEDEPDNNWVELPASKDRMHDEKVGDVFLVFRHFPVF